MIDDNFEYEIESLKSVLDRLDDVAMVSLRSFIENKDPYFKNLEKRIHRARRAILKAISELEKSDQLQSSDQID